MPAEPQPEHLWLQQMVGAWTSAMEAWMGPDKPPETFRGTDVVRSLGGLWRLVLLGWVMGKHLVPNVRQNSVVSTNEVCRPCRVAVELAHPLF